MAKKQIRKSKEYKTRPNKLSGFIVYFGIWAYWKKISLAEYNRPGKKLIKKIHSLLTFLFYYGLVIKNYII